MSLGGRPTARGLAPQRVLKPAEPMSDSRRRLNYAHAADQVITGGLYVHMPPLKPGQRRRARKKANHAAKPPVVRQPREPATPMPGPHQPLAPFIGHLRWDARVRAALHPERGRRPRQVVNP